jgi:hypothetical protein
VVCHQQKPVGLTVNRQQTGEVVVEAELTALRGTGLAAHVELRCGLGYRITPTDHDALLVAIRDDDGVLAVGRNGVELHPYGCLSWRRRRRGRGCGGSFVLSACGQHRTCAYRQYRDTARLQHRAPRHRLGDIAEVVVVTGVADRLGAGVAALESASHMRSLGLAVVGDEEVQRHQCHGREFLPHEYRAGFVGRTRRMYGGRASARLSESQQQNNGKLPVRQVCLPPEDLVGTLAAWPSTNSTDRSGSSDGCRRAAQPTARRFHPTKR